MTVSTVLVAFLVMLAIMMAGMPIAVVMVFMGAIGGVLAFGWPLVDSMGPVMWGVMNENLLTAIPLFILLGELMLRSGMADRMYESLSLWLNRLPGGLLHSNIGCCALFAATSGSSVATAATVGTVAVPALNARGYDKSRSLGSIAAGGTLGILIPPSVNLLIYGSLSETSIGQLFVAGIVPGLLLTSLFMVYIVISSQRASAVNAETAMTGDGAGTASGDAARLAAGVAKCAGTDTYGSRGAGQQRHAIPLRVKIASLRALIAPAIIFGIVMGSIYLGIATPTESAALGVVAALILAAQGGHLSIAFFNQCFVQTARTTGMVLLIVLSAFVLNLTLSLTGVAQLVTTWVTSLGLSPTVLLLIFVLFYILLGMFMDVLSMMVLTIPIAVPVVVAAGIDPIWFGIFIIIMCELGMITPPVGMNLYVVHGIRKDEGPFSDVVRGVIPYVLIMVAFALLLILFPGMATWLPKTMYAP